jgi:hypothetical protein
MPIDRERVAKILTERGAVKPCHRCDQRLSREAEGVVALAFIGTRSRTVSASPSTAPLIVDS